MSGCAVRVYGPNQPFGGSYCSKPVKCTVNGRDYCATHNPEAEARRRARSDAKWAEENATREAVFAAKKEVERRAGCYEDLLKALIATEFLYSDGTLLANKSGAGAWINSVRAAIAKATGATP